MTASDLIDAVNALRAANGLPAYRVNAILMGTAQAQANYMASIGSWSHTGPGGSTVTQRILAAGYPLAGDLTMGGLRAENVCEEPVGTTAQQVVNKCWADAEHMATMLSSALVDIGAGVATSNGLMYFDIDCAQPTSSGHSLFYTPSSGSSPETAVSGTPASLEPTVAVAIVNTPDKNGNVYYVVQPGQTLWQIALAYKTTVDQLKTLNNLSSDSIYDGQRLFISKAGTVTPTLAAATATVDLSTPTALPTYDIYTDTPTATDTAVPVAPVSAPQGAGGAMLAIVVVAIIAAGLVSWIGRSRPV